MGSKTTTLDSSGNNTTQMPWTVGGELKDLPEKEAYLNTYLNGEYLNRLAEKEQVIPHMFNVGVTRSSSSDTIEDIVNHEKTYKWYGKIGLITPSEYIKASTDESCTNIYAASKSPNPCKNGNYLFNSSNYWTISPYSYPYAYFVWFLYYSGNLNNDEPHMYGDARPVLYLSSDISLEGDGTSSSPYTIK